MRILVSKSADPLTITIPHESLRLVFSAIFLTALPEFNAFRRCGLSPILSFRYCSAASRKSSARSRLRYAESSSRLITSSDKSSKNSAHLSSQPSYSHIPPLYRSRLFSTTYTWELTRKIVITRTILFCDRFQNRSQPNFPIFIRTKWLHKTVYPYR